MINLNKNERRALKHIYKRNGNVTDYQLSRYLISKMDPNEVQTTLVRIRQLNLAEIVKDDGFSYWKITPSGVNELGQ